MSKILSSPLGKREEFYKHSPPDKGELEGVILDGVSHIPYDARLKQYARENRKNPTEAEKKVWGLLSRRKFEGFKFTRQKPLENFIVDFYCAELLLGIEIDGDSHASQKEYDQLRSDILEEKYHIIVIRYSNTDVLNSLEGVYEDLLVQVEERRRKI